MCEFFGTRNPMVMSDLYKFQYPDMFPDIVVQFLVPKSFPVPNFMSTIMGIIFGTFAIFTQRSINHK